MTYELFVPLGSKKWISANEHTTSLGARRGISNRTKAWREETSRLAFESGSPVLMEHAWIDVYVHMATNRRYDPGNRYPTAKACVDGLVDAGLVEDDDYKHVSGPFLHHGGKDKDNPGLRIIVRSIE